MFVFQLPPTYRNLFGSEFLGGAPTSICDFVLRVFVFPFVPKSKNVYSICYDVYGGSGPTVYKGGGTDTITGGGRHYNGASVSSHVCKFINVCLVFFSRL